MQGRAAVLILCVDISTVFYELRDLIQAPFACRHVNVVRLLSSGQDQLEHLPMIIAEESGRIERCVAFFVREICFGSSVEEDFHITLDPLPNRVGKRRIISFEGGQSVHIGAARHESLEGLFVFTPNRVVEGAVSIPSVPE